MQQIIYLGCPTAARPEVARTLSAASLSVIWADNIGSVLSELQRHDMPVLLDLSQGAAAVQNARELRHHRASTLMFAIVDARRPDLTTEAVLAGMADVFARPLGGRGVAAAIERERGYESGKQAASRTSAPALDDLYCHSPAMREVASLIARAATMRAGVMVKGERGTGRQLIARIIHHSEAAAPGAFVTIDCASYGAGRLDRDLFGATAIGSTAGSDRGLEDVSRDSLLWAANGGTMYFQNIEEAPTRVQSRLARVLRDREAVLVDDGKTIALDLRPILASGPGIDASVHEGRVREDLFRRLSVIRVDVPPLRNRREDIPALANFLVREVCAARGVPPKTLSRPALALVAALPWHGNAIELRTLMEAIAGSLGVGRGIGLEDVLLHVRLDGGSVVFANRGTLRQARAQFEREYIAAVLEQHQGRISDTAKALGIQRTNLYRKMRTLNVARDGRR